jgi:hypothetical protein
MKAEWNVSLNYPDHLEFIELFSHNIPGSVEKGLCYIFSNWCLRRNRENMKGEK